MKKFAVFAVLLLLAVACVPSLAAPNARDEFIYPAASVLHGQVGGVGWANAWNTYIGSGNFLMTNGGLAFPGLVTNGNAVKNTQSVLGGFSASTRHTIKSYGGNSTDTWFQFLVRPDDLRAQWGSLVINEPGVGSGLQFGISPVNKQLYVQQGNGGPSAVAGYAGMAAGQTYLVQSHLVIDGGGDASMSAYLWRNNGGVPQQVASILNWGLLGDWSGAMIDIELYSSGQMVYDQFVITDRRNDPVPEAGTMVALGSFLSMGGLFLRRRFAKS
jgi:hypothetical protein